MIDKVTMLGYIYLIFAVLVGFTFHEYAHAVAADRLGDKTPKLQGRLTINPFVHIDIVGFICILLFRFGWAKPVQTNPNAYKNKRRDDFIVSIAGPLANFLVAIVAAAVIWIIITFRFNGKLVQVIYDMALVTMSLNCMLMVLNLLPLPGFDGAHILADIFPFLAHTIYNKVHRYGTIIFLLLALPLPMIGIPILYYLVGVPSAYVLKFISTIFGI